MENSRQSSPGTGKLPERPSHGDAGAGNQKPLGSANPPGTAEAEGAMSTRRVVVEAPAGASSSMPLQRHKAPFRGAQSSSSLDSLPASRTIAVGGLARTPRVYVGMTPSGCTGGLGARVTRRALGISSVFLQGLRSSGLATAPAPGLERDLSAVEDLGGCLVEYMAKVHALEKISQELEAQLRMHLDSKATRSESCSALRASWTSSCQQVSAWERMLTAACCTSGGSLSESKGAEAGGREVSGLRPERLTLTPYASMLKPLMTITRITGPTIY